MEVPDETCISWLKISCGFDVGEETANFGTRAVAESENNSCLYETVTRAVIQPSDDNYAGPVPNCILASCSTQVAISLNSSLSVFPVDFSNVHLSYDCGSFPVEAMVLSEDGSFLFIVSRDAMVLAIHINSKMSIPLILKLNPEPSTQCDLTYLIFQDGRSHLYIADSTQRLFRLPILDELSCIPLEEDFEKREALFKEVLSNTSFEILEQSTKESSEKPVMCSFIKNGCPGVVWATSTSMKVFVDDYCYSFHLEINREIIKEMIISPCSSYVLCLVETGIVYVLSLNLGVTLDVWNEKMILSFTRLSPSLEDPFNFQIMALVQDPQPQLCLFDLPKFSVVLSLSVPEKVILLPNLLMDDTLIYVEAPNQMMEFKFKCMEESMPSMRLERLVLKGRFKEAELLAKTFGLDTDRIQQAKVERHINLLNPIRGSLTSSNEGSQIFNDLMSTLATIKDMEFVFDTCIRALMPDVRWTEMILKFALEKAKQSKFEDMDLINEVMDLRTRLNLFFLLDLPNKYQEWIHFASADLIIGCQQFLDKGDIEKACTVLSTLKICYPDTCHKRINELLQAYLPELNTKELFSWFEALFSTILTVAPDLLCNAILEIATLIRCHFTRILDKEESCEEGIEALRRLADMLQPLTPLSDDSVIVVDMETYKLIPWLCSQLVAWNYLRSAHSIIIPFDLLSTKHSEEVCRQIIFYLFDFVPITGIRFLVQDYVMPFCQESGISCDKTICDYLIDYMNPFNWWDEDHKCWEETCTVFADCVSSKMEKVDLIIMMLNKAVVPWSDSMTALASQSSESFPSRAGDIHKSIQMSKKKIIWKKYNLLPDIDYNDTYAILQYIVNQGRDSFWCDMKSYADACGDKCKFLPYEIYISHSFTKGHLKSALDEIVCELSEGDLQVIRNWATVHLDVLLQPRRRSRDLITTESVEVLTSFINNSIENKKRDDIRSKYFTQVLRLKEFGVDVQPSELCLPEQRKSVFDQCINFLLEVKMPEIEANSKDIFLCVKNYCITAATVLCLPREVGFLHLARISLNKKKLKMLDIALRILYEDWSWECIEDAIDLIVELSIGILFAVPMNSTFNCVFHYVHNLVSVALTQQKKIHFYGNRTKLLIINDLLFIVNKSMDRTMLDLHSGIARIASTSHQLTQVYSPITSEFLHLILKEFFDQSGKVVKQEDENCIKEEGACSLSYHEKTDFNQKPGVDLVGQMYSSFVQKCSVDMYSLSAVNKIHWLLSTKSLLEKPVLKETNKAILMLYSNNLLNLLSVKSFNMTCALALLHHFVPANQLMWLENVRQGKSRQSVLLRNTALLGNAYCSLHELPQSESYFKQYIAYKWDNRLRKFNLRLPIDYNSNEQLEMLLLRFMKVPDVPLKLIERFCIDFMLDYQKMILIYLNVYLTLWTPIFSDKTFEDPEEMKSMFNHGVQQLKAFCLKISLDVESKANLRNMLVLHVWPKISLYNYEVFYVIIEMLENPDSTTTSTNINFNHLLTFLVEYKRVGPPSEFETDHWNKISSKTDNLPKLAKYRLPFCAFNGEPETFTSFIKCEFQLSTYVRWINLSSWVSHPIDKKVVCLSAITNLKTECSSSSTSWELDCGYKDLLNQVDECISRTDSLELATSALYFVANHVIPPGADQLDCIQRCNIKANEWLQLEQTEESIRQVKKVKQKYLNISTTHLLYKNKLAQPEYLSLVSSPKELINALYRDPRIVSSDTQDDYDINAIVDKICYLYDVKDLSMIKMELLMGWLEGDTSSLDDTSILGSLPCHVSDSSSDLKRACYMMKGEDPQKACSMLLGFVLNEGPTSTGVPKTNPLRMRGLQCLMTLVSPNQLEMISNKKISFFQNLLRKLEIICLLEGAGLYFCDDGSDEGGLVTAIEGLIRSELRSETSLIAAKIVSFPFKSPDIMIPFWTPVISSLTRFYQVTALEKYLPMVTKFAYLLDTAALTSAWQLLIESVLKGDNDKCSKYFERNILELLQCCVVHQKIKLTNILPLVKNDHLKYSIKKIFDVCHVHDSYLIMTSNGFSQSNGF